MPHLARLFEDLEGLEDLRVVRQLLRTAGTMRAHDEIQVIRPQTRQAFVDGIQYELFVIPFSVDASPVLLFHNVAECRRLQFLPLGAKVINEVIRTCGSTPLDGLGGLAAQLIQPTLEEMQRPQAAGRGPVCIRPPP